MNRIGKYQENMQIFIKNKGFLSKTTSETRKILKDMLELSDHVPAILCLTILNSRCKKYNLKIHGYYIAASVDILMMVAKICSNREHFNSVYGCDTIDNMIIEIINWFYWSVSQNIETLLMNKNDRYNNKTLQLCIECCVKYIPKILQKTTHTSTKRVRKTDIYAYHPSDIDFKNNYKRKTMLDKDVLKSEIENRYGAVCCLAICLGWIVGQGDETIIDQLDCMGKYFGTFLKVSDDFLNLDRDVMVGTTSTNYVINYGIKDAYTEIVEAHIHFMEELMKHEIDTKTMKETIDMVVKMVDDVMNDISVDMDTQYNDECSVAAF